MDIPQLNIDPLFPTWALLPLPLPFPIVPTCVPYRCCCAFAYRITDIWYCRPLRSRSGCYLVILIALYVVHCVACRRLPPYRYDAFTRYHADLPHGCVCSADARANLPALLRIYRYLTRDDYARCRDVLVTLPPFIPSITPLLYPYRCRWLRAFADPTIP